MNKTSYNNKNINTEKPKSEIAMIINDVIRLVIVFTLAHLLECALHDDKTFFNNTFVTSTIYFAIGTILYHVIFKKIVFVSEETKN